MWSFLALGKAGVLASRFGIPKLLGSSGSPLELVGDFILTPLSILRLRVCLVWASKVGWSKVLGRLSSVLPLTNCLWVLRMVFNIRRGRVKKSHCVFWMGWVG